MAFQNDRITSIPAPLPVDYDRQFSFTDFEIQFPNLPKPGDSLDVEFNAIEQAIDETQARLRLIQRDDGALANQSVGLDQLKSDIQIGVNSPSAWMEFTQYQASDSVIVDGGIWYVALESHTSTDDFAADLAAGRWQELLNLTPFTEEAKNWANYPEDQPVPEGEGEFSAKHYAAKSEDAALAVVASRVRWVGDLASLKAVSTSTLSDGAGARITSTGRAGDFYWDSSDLFTEVTADTQEGIYVAPAGGDGTDGAWVRKVNGFVTPEMYGAGPTADSASAIQSAVNYGQCELSGQYVLSSGIQLSGECRMRNVKFVFDTDTVTCVELMPGLSMTGLLEVDVTSVTCTNVVLLDGRRQPLASTAPVADTIIVRGNSSANTNYALHYDSTTAAGDNRSFVQFSHIKQFSARDCNTGLQMTSSESGGITDGWVNANLIDNLTLSSCVKFIEMDATLGGEIASNEVSNYTLQYGAGSGAFPTSAVNLQGSCGSNRISGFIYDWNYTSSPFPLIELGSDTYSNEIRSSALPHLVVNNGSRNRHICSNVGEQQNSMLFTLGNMVGNQSNVLGNFIGSTGALVTDEFEPGATVTPTGTPSDVFTENLDYLTLNFTSGSGTAFYELELTPTSDRPQNMNAVHWYFAEGFLPESVSVDIDDGSGTYTPAASFGDIYTNSFFCKFDSSFSSGTDVVASVRRIRFRVYASDTREVRLIQISANGEYRTTYVSRGGDRMTGDILFESQRSIVLKSPDGTEWKVNVDNAGNLSTASGPVKTLTWG